MIVEISPTTKRILSDMAEKYGYRSEGDLLEDALRRRFLELKKADFLKKTAKIKNVMEKCKITEKSILKDFGKFYHQK